jgi:hypothetical protein
MIIPSRVAPPAASLQGSRFALRPPKEKPARMSNAGQAYPLEMKNK